MMVSSDAVHSSIFCKRVILAFLARSYDDNSVRVILIKIKLIKIKFNNLDLENGFSKRYKKTSIQKDSFCIQTLVRHSTQP